MINYLLYGLEGLKMGPLPPIESIEMGALLMELSDQPTEPESEWAELYREDSLG